MSNGKGITILGLIFGLLGLGLGGYVFYDTTLAPLFGLKPTDPGQEIINYYEYDSAFVPPSVAEYNIINTMSIETTIEKISSLYVLFNCYVFTSNPDVIIAELHINGEDEARTRVTTQSTSPIRTSATLQFYNQSIPPGTYNISIWVAVGDAATTLYENSLFVQIISLN